MSGAVFLEGENIELRTIEEEDLEFVRDNFNHPEVMDKMSYFRPVNLEQEKKWFENNVVEGDDVHLAICEDGEMRGIISLKMTKGEEGAEIGLWIAKDYHGQGLGTVASRLIIEYGFSELGLHRVTAKAFECNRGSQRIWEKLGFEKEGELRGKIYRDGSYENVYVYGVLEGDLKN